MSDWDDQNIDQADESIPAPAPVRELERIPGWLLGAAASLALIAGLGIYWLFSDKSPVTVSEPSPGVAASSAVEPEPAEPPARDEPEIALPALSDSDGYVREALSRLSRHPAIVSLLVSDELVRKLVAAVVNVAEGDNPSRHFPLLAPDESFEVVRASRPSRVFVDPRGYHRYDVLAEGFASLDAGDLAAAYRASRPLFEEAYGELGYLEAPFETTLSKAFLVLLQTPVVEGRIPLEAESVNYTYADARLEALSPAQKQLLRMGPANTRRIQSKLRELEEALELPSAL